MELSPRVARSSSNPWCDSNAGDPDFHSFAHLSYIGADVACIPLSIPTSLFAARCVSVCLVVDIASLSFCVRCARQKCQ